MSTRPRSLAVIALLLSGLPWQRAAADTDEAIRAARLSVIEGSVSVLPNATSTWTAAVVNQPLSAGDQVWTDGGARTEIDFGAVAVRLSGATAISLLTLSEEGIQVGVNAGTVEVARHDADANEWTELDAPQAALSLLTDGSYRISVARDGASLVSVLSGRAELASRAGGSLGLREGQAAQFAADGTLDVATLGPADDFDRWCTRRDTRWQQENASAAYLSDDVPGAGQLSDAGQWQEEPDLGQVWFPYGVPADWAPYQSGQWLYMPAWGWTWIDLEPWGFAPFHYGRWARIGGRWAWVPPPSHARPVFAGALADAPPRPVTGRQAVLVPARVTPPVSARHPVLAMRTPGAQTRTMPEVLTTPASRSVPLLSPSSLLSLPAPSGPTFHNHASHPFHEAVAPEERVAPGAAAASSGEARIGEQPAHETPLRRLPVGNLPGRDARLRVPAPAPAIPASAPLPRSIPAPPQAPRIP